jgi:hypothetical protein
MGEAPDWLPITEVAEMLHMDPRQVIDIPTWWQNKLLIARAARTEAEALIAAGKAPKRLMGASDGD